MKSIARAEELDVEQGHQTILVIEDDAHYRSNVCELLEAEGYVTQVAASAEDGLVQMYSTPPDLVLADINLPGEDGFTLFDKARPVLDQRRIPFIFISCRSALDDTRFGMGLGADDYLVKPVRSSDLLCSIRSRLERFRSVSASATAQCISVHSLLDYVSGSLNRHPVTHLHGMDYIRKLVQSHHYPQQQPCAILILRFRPDVTQQTNGLAIDDEQLQRAFIHRILHLGGDEGHLIHLHNGDYALLMTATDISEAREVASVVANAFRYSVCVGDAVVSANLLIGITHFAVGDLTLNQAIRRAQVSIEVIQNRGLAGSVGISSPLLDSETAQHLYEVDIWQGLRKSELNWVSIPQHSLHDDDVVGHRLSLQWQHPTRGLISADHILDYVESSELAQQAVEVQLAAVKRRLRYADSARNLCVRLHSSQIKNGLFEESFRKVFRGYDASAGKVTFEFSELCFSSCMNDVRSAIHAVMEHGYKAGVFEVGSGQCHLSYLSQYPITHAVVSPYFTDALTGECVGQVSCAQLLRGLSLLSIRSVWPVKPSARLAGWLIRQGCTAYEAG